MAMEDIVGKGAVLAVASVGIFALIFLMALLMAWPTKLCVNYLFTPTFLQSVFGVTRFDIWHGLILNCLGGLIFKGTSTSSSSK